MDLITDSKDERLADLNRNNRQSGAMEAFSELFRESLVCALEELHGRRWEMDTHGATVAREHLDAALSRAEAAEAENAALEKEAAEHVRWVLLNAVDKHELQEAKTQLCAAREALEFCTVLTLAHDIHDYARRQLEELSPCPHAARIKEAEENKTGG